MSQLVSAQIRLRRAFRYGYFAFIGGVALALLVLALRSLSSDAATLLSLPLPDASLWPTLALLVIALCVPLFFACWLLIGKAVLRRTSQNRPFTDRVAD